MDDIEEDDSNVSDDDINGDINDEYDDFDPLADLQLDDDQDQDEDDKNKELLTHAHVNIQAESETENEDDDDNDEDNEDDNDGDDEDEDDKDKDNKNKDKDFQKPKNHQHPNKQNSTTPQQTPGTRWTIIVPDEERQSSNMLTLAEATRAIAIRAKQISNHPHVYTDIANLTDEISIARKELFDRCSPLILEREVGRTSLGESIIERWSVRKMTLPPLT